MLLACFVIKHGVQGTAGCPALQCSNISSLPAPSTPANGLLPASSNTQQRAQVMPAASTDVDVPPTQQPLVHTEALVTDQLSGGQCRSRSDELATMDVDTTPAPAPAASEATAPALKSHVNRVTATATGLHAASQDQLSTGQRVVRQSRGKGRPAGSQPYSTPANTLLPTCFQAASSALAAALTPPPQASFNHSTELSDLGEQHVVILYQPSAGCTSTEIATWVQCATHFALPPNTGAAGTNRRTLAHGGRDAVPAYSHITQNVYTRGVVKPQRLHEDEVPVCTCQRSALDGFAVPASLRRSSRHRAGSQVQHWCSHSPMAVVTSATPTAAAPCASLHASAKGCNAMVQTCLHSANTSANVRSVSEDGAACGAFCLNRQLFICCDSRICPSGSNCTNK